MSYRIPLLFVFVVAAAQSASAQAPKSPPAATDTRLKSTQDVHIVLEVRWLAVNDSLEERVEPKLEELPGLGEHVLRDQQQTHWLVAVAEGDKRSNSGPLQRVTLLSGQKRELSPPRAGQDEGAILATVSDDRQTIQIHLTWPKRKDGAESLPATTAEVPIGSHLLIHTEEFIASGKMAPVSRWQRFQDWLFNQKRATAWREKQQVFLLVSPRIALLGEKAAQMAAE
jgi:hypothetical protein